MSRYALKKSPHDEGVTQEKVPTGFYTFQITDYKEKDKEGNWLETKNGDPKLYLICEVVGSKEDDGKGILHTLVFYKPDSPSIKGIGMTRHFLKCIGEPWEGDLEPNPDNWVGKRFCAEVVKNGEYMNLIDIQPTGEVTTVNDSKVKPEDIAWDE